jgi:hypothetical protein
MTPRLKKPKTVTRALRLPETLNEWIAYQARLARRSWNGQVVYMLELLQRGALIKEDDAENNRGHIGNETESE